MSRPCRCEICDAAGHWRIERHGDVVTSWACPDHLSDVCDAMQRDHEITRLSVTLAAKATEWAQIGEALRQIATEGP